MRLIDADALERKLMEMSDEDLCEDCCYNVVNAIAEMPTVGVKQKQPPKITRCDCGAMLVYRGRDICPNCGRRVEWDA